MRQFFAERVRRGHLPRTSGVGAAVSRANSVIWPKLSAGDVFQGRHVENDAANHHHGFEDHGDERRGQRTRGRGDVHQVILARHLTYMRMWGR